MILFFRRLGFLLCLLVFVLATPGLSSGAAKPSVQVEWIRRNAIPLKTVEAGNGFDDITPLEHIVGDARVVALGEATHGTREFFQLKHRIIEFSRDPDGLQYFHNRSEHA